MCSMAPQAVIVISLSKKCFEHTLCKCSVDILLILNANSVFVTRLPKYITYLALLRALVLVTSASLNNLLNMAALALNNSA